MKINPEYLLKNIAGRDVLIPTGQKIIDSDKIIKLNETGVFIFEQLKEERTFDELAELLAQKFNATDENDLKTIKADLTEFLEYAKSHDTIINY